MSSACLFTENLNKENISFAIISLHFVKGTNRVRMAGHKAMGEESNLQHGQYIYIFITSFYAQIPPCRLITC